MYQVYFTNTFCFSKILLILRYRNKKYAYTMNYLEMRKKKEFLLYLQDI